MGCHSKQWYEIIISHLASSSSESHDEFWLRDPVPFERPHEHFGVSRCTEISTRITFPRPGARAAMLTITSTAANLADNSAYTVYFVDKRSLPLRIFSTFSYVSVHQFRFLCPHKPIAVGIQLAPSSTVPCDFCGFRYSGFRSVLLSFL